MRNRILTLTLGAMLFQNVYAAPTIHPDKRTQDVLNSIEKPNYVSLVADSENPKKVYVLPPQEANVELTGLHSTSGNILYCARMEKLQGYALETEARLGEWHKIYEKQTEEYQKLQDEIGKAKEEAARFAHNEGLAELTDIDARLEIVNAEMQEILNVKLIECKGNCVEFRRLYQQLLKERTQLTQRRMVASRNNVASAQKYEQMKKIVEAKETTLVSKKKENDELEERIIRLKNLYDKTFDHFGQLEGGQVGILFRSPWTEQIEELSRLNPGINFEKMDTRNTLVTSNVTGITKMPGKTVLELMIGGEPVKEEDGVGVRFSSYISSFSGNVRLSLLMVCPLKYPDAYKTDIEKIEDVNYGIITSYEYPRLANVSASVKYSMSQLATKITTSGSSGGGFWKKRRSWSSIEERNHFGADLDITWIDHTGMTAEQKNAREKEMIDRVYANMAVAALPALGAIGDLKLPQLPPSGATVLSENLSSACPNRNICRSAMIGANVLEAMFGRSQATANYLKRLEGTSTERWSHTDILWYPQTTSYMRTPIN